MTVTTRGTHTSPARRLLLAAAMVACASAASFGHGMFPNDVPIDRLIANIQKYIDEHPKDAEAYYRLGRAHTLALETRTEFVPVFEGTTLPRIAEGSWSKRSPNEDKSRASTPEQINAHLEAAIKNLNKAIELRPNTAKFRLTLAAALEAGIPYISKTKVWPLAPSSTLLQSKDDDTKERIARWKTRFNEAATKDEALSDLLKGLSPEEWNDRTRDTIVALAIDSRDREAFAKVVATLREADWKEQVELQYFAAVCLALPKEGKVEAKPIWGGLEDWVSYEAATCYVRFVESRAVRPTDHVRLKTAKAIAKAFEELPPPTAITPIIINPGAKSLADTVAPGVSVTFDLDGSGTNRRWPWLTPDTGLLVWDPDRTGRITSGRQLFGSVSWWIMFDTGYQALDALDDNRDGLLSGDELRGVRVWFDRNSDGKSESAEVVDLAALNITALSTHACGLDHGSPVAMNGATLANGATLPTWDWVTAPLPRKSSVQPIALVGVGALGACLCGHFIHSRRGRA